MRAASSSVCSKVLGLDAVQARVQLFGKQEANLFLGIGMPGTKVERNLLYYPEPFDMVGVKVGEDEVVDAADATTVQQTRDFRWRVNEEVDVIKEGGRTCPGVGNTPLPSLLADPALAKWLGGYHTTPGAQNSPLHIGPQRSFGRAVGDTVTTIAMVPLLLEGVPAHRLFLICRRKQLQELIVIEEFFERGEWHTVG